MSSGIVHLSMDLRCRYGRPQNIVLLDLHAHILVELRTRHNKVPNVDRPEPGCLRACLLHVCPICVVANDGGLSTIAPLLGSIYWCEQW